MTNPQFNSNPTDREKGNAGSDKEVEQTWDRPKRPKQGGTIDDPAGGARRGERDPLPHHRDLPGQETPDQDPDLEPTIGDDEDAEPDTFPTDEQQGGRSIPL
jgi:hypothetical protein